MAKTNPRPFPFLGTGLLYDHGSTLLCPTILASFSFKLKIALEGLPRFRFPFLHSATDVKDTSK